MKIRKTEIEMNNELRFTETVLPETRRDAARSEALPWEPGIGGGGGVHVPLFS